MYSLSLFEFLDKMIFELKGKLGQREQCECNLTEIEEGIRNNGISIENLRSDVADVENSIADTNSQVDVSTNTASNI